MLRARSRLLSDETMAGVEKHFDARFVMETCPVGRNGEFINQPLIILWTDKKHPEGSNYIGLSAAGDQWMVTDGLPHIKDVVFTGCVDDDGFLYNSRYRHDFTQLKNGVALDGGRDYLRVLSQPDSNGVLIGFRVVDDHLESVETEDDDTIRS